MVQINLHVDLSSMLCKDMFKDACNNFRVLVKQVQVRIFDQKKKKKKKSFDKDPDLLVHQEYKMEHVQSSLMHHHST